MNDEHLANLLGEKPPGTDIGFRLEALARAGALARRDAARRRALVIVLVSTAVGTFFGLAQASGFTIERMQPLLYALAAAGSAYVLMQEAARGPRSSLARSLGQLRLRL